MVGRLPPARRALPLALLLVFIVPVPSSAYQTEIKTTAAKVEVQVDPSPECQLQTAWSITYANGQSVNGSGGLALPLAKQEVTLTLSSPCDGYCNYGIGEINCRIMHSTGVRPTPLPIAPRADGLPY